jgi:hypothetical protein
MTTENTSAGRKAVLLILSAGLIGLFIASHYRSNAVAEQAKADILDEMLERYTKEPRLFLADYQKQNISPEDAIAILIMMRIEDGGVFLPPEEIDPYEDYHYIHRERHEEMLRRKAAIYQRGFKVK